MSGESLVVHTPLDPETARRLRAGQRVLLRGVVYAARDAAHKRMVEALEQGGSLPFPPEGAVIYYVGPTPAPPGRPIGAAGPTTSGRMDGYAPALLAQGVRGMIGKGYRSPAVKEALRQYGAVYLAATGGAGALLSRCIVQSEVIAYPDLGPEAVLRLEVLDFPAVVVNDAQGGDLYEAGKKQYALPDETGGHAAG
ncbi:MAG: Fe-S-containing hydro-lyase [Firmicutes bacterium]|nr:Fe-S-containing hydro-lyase [Bacillota bacterium]